MLYFVSLKDLFLFESHRKREEDREMEILRDLPPADFTPQVPQLPELATEAWRFSQVFDVGSNSPDTWTIFCCFFHAISWVAGWKVGKLGTNWHPFVLWALHAMALTATSQCQPLLVCFTTVVGKCCLWKWIR